MTAAQRDTYDVTVSYSPEDETFVARVPALAGCVADGASREDAVTAAREAIDVWLETARKRGWAIPAAAARPIAGDPS